MHNNLSFFYKAKADFIQEAIDLFARMSVQPTFTQKTVINKTIVDLKAAGIWQLMDVLLFTHSHTEQAALLNWIKNASNGILSNSPIFTAYQGILSAVGKYINCNYIPSVNAITYQSVNCSFGLSTTTEIQSNSIDLGRSTTGTTISIINIRTTANLFTGRINNLISPNVSLSETNANSLGLSSCELNGTTMKIYRNGVERATRSHASAGVPSTNMLCGLNAPRNYNFYYFGAALTSTQHTQLNSILNYYILNYQP